MLKDTITCDSKKCWICKLLFLVCLVSFALSPVAEAYADTSQSPLTFSNGQNDDDDPPITDELELNEHVDAIRHRIFEIISRYYHAHLQVSSKCWPVCRIEQIQIAADNTKSSQTCPPLSSDLAPPVI